MVQIDIPIAFAVGQMLADAASQQLKTGEPGPYYRTLALTNIFTGCFFAPIPVYFLIDYFGWETTYMYEPSRVTRFFLPLVLCGLILAANLGFWLSNRLIQRGRPQVGRLLYALIWLYALAWILGHWPRATRIGTYAQYHMARETMPRAWEVAYDPFLYILMVSLMIFFVPLVLCLQWLHQQGEKKTRALEPGQ